LPRDVVFRTERWHAGRFCTSACWASESGRAVPFDSTSVAKRRATPGRRRGSNAGRQPRRARSQIGRSRSPNPPRPGVTGPANNRDQNGSDGRRGCRCAGPPPAGDHVSAGKGARPEIVTGRWTGPGERRSVGAAIGRASDGRHYAGARAGGDVSPPHGLAGSLGSPARARPLRREARTSHLSRATSARADGSLGTRTCSLRVAGVLSRCASRAQDGRSARRSSSGGRPARRSRPARRQEDRWLEGPARGKRRWTSSFKVGGQPNRARGRYAPPTRFSSSRGRPIYSFFRARLRT